MRIIIFWVFITFDAGLFLLLSGILRLPTLRTSRAMMDTGREGKKLSRSMDALYMDGAVRLSAYIRMNDYLETIAIGYLEAGFDVERLAQSVANCADLVDQEEGTWNQQLLS